MSKKPRVLLIEDDKFILKAMSIKFTDSGFETKTSHTAEDGFKVLEKWLPNVIILDIVLPGISGYEFLKKIKANAKWKNIPVIVASNLQPDEKAYLATEYIVKSDLDLDSLVQKALRNI